MPPWGLVRRIDASHFDPGTAYMAVDYHLVDNRDPYLFKTTDFGQTWTRIDADLPKGHPLDYTLSIAENPHRKGMVFAGTGHGFFYSLDDGKTWTQFKDKLPAAPVNWIEVPKNAAEVAVATYGRGLWILRDVWQLEQPEAAAAAPAEMQLYKPRPGHAVSRRRHGGLRVLAQRRAGVADHDGDDRPGRAVDHAGHRCRARAGLNQASWNLLYPAPVTSGAALDSAGQPAHLGGGPLAEPRASGHALGTWRRDWQPRAAPGKYTVRMTLQRQAVHAAVRGVA